MVGHSVRDLVGILLFITLTLGAAEYLTRREMATTRWCILFFAWVTVLALVVWSMA